MRCERPQMLIAPSIKSRIYGCVFVMVIIHATAASAGAVCDRQHMIVEYGGRSCLNNSCETIFQKWQFLGERIFQYNNPSKAEGTVWQLGKTVDMTTDKANTYFAPSAGVGQKETATLAAFQSGADFALTRKNQLTTIFGHVVATNWLRIVIRIPNCERCDLLVYELSGDYEGFPSQSQLDGNWCRVDG